MFITAAENMRTIQVSTMAINLKYKNEEDTKLYG